MLIEKESEGLTEDRPNGRYIVSAGIIMYACMYACVFACTQVYVCVTAFTWKALCVIPHLPPCSFETRSLLTGCCLHKANQPSRVWGFSCLGLLPCLSLSAPQEL